MLNGLDLFSGIGGLTVALSDWVRPIAYCEQDRYDQAVLLSRMQDGEIPCAPIWDDVRTLTSKNFDGRTPIDIVAAGFPCQDISVAGRGVGLVGERSGLFFEIERLVKETNPRFVFLENVPAIRTRGLNTVVNTFTELGYDCRWTIVSAAEVGAPHIRKRWFFLAHSMCNRVGIQQVARPEQQSEALIINDGKAESLAHAAGIRGRARTIESSRPRQQDDFMRKDWWATEPNVGRVVNGLPCRVDRIKGLGNAVVPAQAKEAFKRLMGFNPEPSGERDE